MDIIPVLPAPQQGTAPRPAELSTGNGASGFDNILSREMPVFSPSSQPVEETLNPDNQDKADYLNPEAQTGAGDLDSQEAIASFLNEMSEDIALGAESASGPVLPQSAEGILQQFFFPISGSFIFNRTAVGSSSPFLSRLSASFADVNKVPADFSEIPLNYDGTTNPGNQNRTPPLATNSADTTGLLQAAVLETVKLTAQPMDNTTVSHAVTIELTAGAVPFFAIASESLTLPAEHVIPQSDPASSPPTPATAHHHNGAGAPWPNGFFKPGVLAEQLFDSSRLKHSIPVEKGSTFFESSALLLSISGYPDTAPAAQTAVSAQQPTLLLEELHKLIRNNNDKLTITATFERSAVADNAKSDQLFKHSPANPEQQIGSSENLFRISTAPKGAALTSTQPDMQVKKEHLRSDPMERFQERFLNARSVSAEKSISNSSHHQTTQQHAQSTDGGSLQQQSFDGVVTKNAQPSDQATVSSVFSSQFHDAGSTQSAEPAKIASPGAAYLSQAHDQEIINQIVQRFSLHSRLQTSRLSLQLHPAELGELKIDLIVKGDGLKANIYTQTQRAGEIIDRNLPRLREILQDQGLSIEELAVSFKSDSKDDFTPEHGQLFQDQNSLYSSQEGAKPASTFAQTIEESLLTSAVEPAGVNLTI